MHVGEDFHRARQIVALALNPHAYISYSQFGEDLLIDVFFHGRTEPSFYVDIGAHHPERLSNTHLLYQRGWRGINVEGDPNLIAAFNAARSEDTNISAFVSDKIETVTFSRYSEAAVNTISAEKAVEYANHWNVQDTSQIETTTLANILSQHLPAGRQIDLLSVDVEGVDLEVLQGNDWTRFRPALIVVEADDLDLMNAAAHPVVAFLAGHGYRLRGFVHVSAFFLRVA